MPGIVTQRELNDLLDIVVDCVEGKSLETIHAATWKFGQLVGADKLYWAIPVFGRKGNFVPTPVADFNISYPPEWVQLYKNEKLVTQDPVGQICMTGPGVYSWGDAYRQMPPSKLFLEIKEGAFKLFQGYTSVTIRDNQWSVFSLAGQRVPRNRRNLWLINRVAPYFHDALAALQTKLPTLPSLTIREQQILQEVMIGKTNWDVSVVLNISEGTVKFHMQNIMKKFGVHSRSHAVALAVKHKLIFL